MAKKSYDSSIGEKAHSALASNLFNLIDEPNKLKEHLGCSIQAINQYKMGTTFPKVENLIKIARFYNVSLDWLVGLSAQPSVSVDDKYLTDKVGFTPAAVSRLKAYQIGRPARLQALSKLLEQDEFDYILDDISHCAEMGEWETLFEQALVKVYEAKKELAKVKGIEPEGIEPNEYEKQMIEAERRKDKTATTYDAQYKLSKICERIIKEAETDGKQ